MVDLSKRAGCMEHNTTKLIPFRMQYLNKLKANKLRHSPGKLLLHIKNVVLHTAINLLFTLHGAV